MHPYHPEFTPFSPTIGAVAFWAFVAVVVAMGVFRQISRHRESQTTIRKALEANPNLDPKLLDQLMRGEQQRTSPEHLLLGGVVLIAIGIGLGVMALFIAGGDPNGYAMIGVGAIPITMGLGLLVGSRLIARARREKD